MREFGINYLVLRNNIHLYENKDVNFVCNYYDGDFNVTINNRKIPIKYACNDLFLITKRTDIDRYRRIQEFLLTIGSIIASTTTTFLSSFFTIKGFFPFSISFLKYVVFDFSLLSLWIIFFHNIIKYIKVRRPYHIDYVLNEQMLVFPKKELCSLNKAKKDSISILDDCFEGFYERKISSLFNYKHKKRIINEISNIKNDFNYQHEYRKTLSKIDSTPSLLIAIVSFIIGAILCAINFYKLYVETGTEYLTNMIFITITTPIIMFFATKIIIDNHYNNAYARLDSLLILYSYQYLPMIECQDIPFKDYPIKAKDEKEIEKEKLSLFDSLIKKGYRGCYRNIVVVENAFRVYGIKEEKGDAIVNCL